ncbi:MAG: hypothetical protein F6K36_01090 [Symploca sp. SIO3C6]|uniref:Uncharacterized protein n=1 Tax=Symploca sp. SIO1C4 TaxID=2607765 RepID=A0A6B3N304_9CYAN|nr:hypothetical protein [Symploca sp. SIO3C6]NER27559.1 hypothetical protein [Symploca sp. SIO1C4]NET06659.1 hypothetical protein [Symploca sp. SIO2B6]
MDVVQKQIIALTHKVDALYQIIEQLNSQITQCMSQIGQNSQLESGNLASAPNSRGSSYQSPSLLKSVMEHKDILVDGTNGLSSSYQNSENTLSADVQVQRLTAQLTAAYNRIAALEEQLLARRIHS